MNIKALFEARNRFREAVRSLALGDGDLRNRLAGALPSVFALTEPGPGVHEHIRERIGEYQSVVAKLSTPNSRIDYWVSTMAEDSILEVADWIVSSYGEIISALAAAEIAETN